MKILPSFKKIVLQTLELSTEKELIQRIEKLEKDEKVYLKFKAEIGKAWLAQNFFEYLIQLHGDQQSVQEEIFLKIPEVFQSKQAIENYLKLSGFQELHKHSQQPIMLNVYYYFWCQAGAKVEKKQLYIQFQRLLKECLKLGKDFDKSLNTNTPYSLQDDAAQLFQKYLDLGNSTIVQSQPQLNLKAFNQNQKVLLQEIIQLSEKTIPIYKTTTSAPYSSKVEIIVKDTKYIYSSSGKFNNKKDAEKGAAKVALQNMLADADLRKLIQKFKYSKDK